VKKKVGRPKGDFKVVKNKIDYALIEAACAQGMSKENIAAIFGMDRTTFYDRLYRDKKFKTAVELGNARGEQTLTKNLFSSANSGNVSAIIFALKARYGWREDYIPDNQIEEPIFSEE
jgi:hypothetical protein